MEPMQWVWLIESLVTWCRDITKTKTAGRCHKYSNNQRRFKIRIISSLSQPSAQLLKCGHDIFSLSFAVTVLKNGQKRVPARPRDVTAQTSPPNCSASTSEPNLSRFPRTVPERWGTDGQTDGGTPKDIVPLATMTGVKGLNKALYFVKQMGPVVSRKCYCDKEWILHLSGTIFNCELRCCAL